MSQSVDEVLDDLRKFVRGRGRDDNFCYSKVYSPSSYVRCVDFSPWVGRRLMMNDMFALGVFKAQLSKDSSFGVSLEMSVSDDGEVEIDESDDFIISFDDEVKNGEEEIVKIVKFPFDEYFTGEFKLAKLDIIIAWILGFSREQFARILTAYDLSLTNAQMYLESYNKEKNTQLKPPESLPKNVKVEQFRKEFRKLPLSSRLHLFDVLSYSGFKTKKPKLRLISDMTLYDTRKLGIDEHESAHILTQNKLIVSFPDGTGYIDPEYVDVVSMASEYAKGMAPIHRQWESDVSDKLSGLDDLDLDDFEDTDEDENY
jgi:hypothetical protein